MSETPGLTKLIQDKWPVFNYAPQARMGIRSWYPVPKQTGIAGTGTGSCTLASIIPVPNTGKWKNLVRWYQYYRNTGIGKNTGTGTSTGTGKSTNDRYFSGTGSLYDWNSSFPASVMFLYDWVSSTEWSWGKQGTENASHVGLETPVKGAIKKRVQGTHTSYPWFVYHWEWAGINTVS